MGHAWSCGPVDSYNNGYDCSRLPGYELSEAQYRLGMVGYIQFPVNVDDC